MRKVNYSEKLKTAIVNFTRDKHFDDSPAKSSIRSLQTVVFNGQPLTELNFPLTHQVSDLRSGPSFKYIHDLAIEENKQQENMIKYAPSIFSLKGKSLYDPLSRSILQFLPVTDVVRLNGCNYSSRMLVARFHPRIYENMGALVRKMEEIDKLLKPLVTKELKKNPPATSPYFPEPTLLNLRRWTLIEWHTDKAVFKCLCDMLKLCFRHYLTKNDIAPLTAVSHVLLAYLHDEVFYQLIQPNADFKTFFRNPEYVHLRNYDFYKNFDTATKIVLFKISGPISPKLPEKLQVFFNNPIIFVDHNSFKEKIKQLNTLLAPLILQRKNEEKNNSESKTDIQELNIHMTSSINSESKLDKIVKNIELCVSHFLQTKNIKPLELAYQLFVGCIHDDIYYRNSIYPNESFSQNFIDHYVNSLLCEGNFIDLIGFSVMDKLILSLPQHLRNICQAANLTMGFKKLGCHPILDRRSFHLLKLNDIEGEINRESADRLFPKFLPLQDRLIKIYKAANASVQGQVFIYFSCSIIKSLDDNFYVSFNDHVLQQLLKHMSDLRYTDSNGYTTLMAIARHRRPLYISQFISKLDPSLVKKEMRRTSKNGNTVLGEIFSDMRFNEREFLETEQTIAALIHHGCDPNQPFYFRTPNGIRTMSEPLQVALEYYSHPLKFVRPLIKHVKRTKLASAMKLLEERYFYRAGDREIHQILKEKLGVPSLGDAKGEFCLVSKKIF